MRYGEHLLARAMFFWDRGERLPIDLFSEMLSAGLDVDALERTHMKEPV
jgi:hypothetical protein